TMTFVGGLPKGVVHVLEVALARPGEPLLHILMKLSLVAFESQNIISTLLNDSAGNVLLTTHRVNAHNTTGHIQMLEQFWNSCNLHRHYSYPITTPPQRPKPSLNGCLPVHPACHDCRARFSFPHQSPVPA